MGNCQSPLIEAARYGYAEQLEKIIEEDGSVVDVIDNYNYKTALHYATEKGHLNIAEFLINNGCPFQEKDSIGFTPLHYACKRNHVEIARLLLNNHADVNVRDNQGRTPLHIVCDGSYTNYETRQELVKLLVQSGANLSAKDDYECTPLFYAKKRRYTKMYQYLKARKQRVKKSANISKGDTNISIDITGNSEDLDRIMSALNKLQ